MVIVEQSVEWALAGETEVVGENLPQLHFVHHKSHVTYPGPTRREASDWPPELWHGLHGLVNALQNINQIHHRVLKQHFINY
jgi:hypothetical protein